jgi:hypothetical protein
MHRTSPVLPATALLLAALAFSVQAQTVRELPEAPAKIDSPASGAIILAPGLDNGAREKPGMKPPVTQRGPRDGILEPNASSGAGSTATDPQTENRRGAGDPSDSRNRRDDTGKRDNQDR